MKILIDEETGQRLKVSHIFFKLLTEGGLADCTPLPPKREKFKEVDAILEDYAASNGRGSGYFKESQRLSRAIVAEALEQAKELFVAKGEK